MNINTMNKKVLTVSCLVLASASFPAVQAAGDTKYISRAYMPRDCRETIEQRYALQPGTVTSFPAEQHKERVKVYAETKSGSKKYFTCSYSLRGELLNIEKGKKQSGSGNNQSGKHISRADMPRYCKGVAAERYGVRKDQVTTLLAEKTNGKFKVDGQTPPNTRDAKSFTCHFDSNGKFLSFSKGSGGNKQNNKKISRADMPGFCKGEAADRYRVRRDQVKTLPAEKYQGKFKVDGQTPPNALNANYFTCHFDGSGRFLSFDKGHKNPSQSLDKKTRERMSEACASKAAKSYNKHLKEISVQSPVKSNGRYTVHGRYPSTAGNKRIEFVCSFTNDHKLNDIKVKR